MEQEKSKIVLAGRTDVGCVRDHNEDNFHIAPDIAQENWTFNAEAIEVGDKGSLLMVADGMGGTNAGEVASEIAVNSVIGSFKKLKQVPKNDKHILDFLQKALIHASAEIVAHASKNKACEGMGTTAVLAWILNHKVYIAWSGDSRLYRAGRDSKIQCLTRDHSLVWEMVEQGHLSPEEARTHPESNIITQNLGDPFRKPEPDATVFPLFQGDRILLCTDGLNSELEDEIIDRILKLDKNPSEIAIALIDAAKSAGGHDNITVLVVDVIEAPASALHENVTLKATKKKSGLLKWMILAVIAMAIGGYTMLKKGYFAVDGSLPTQQPENTIEEPIPAQANGVANKAPVSKPPTKEKVPSKSKQQKVVQEQPVLSAPPEEEVVDAQKREAILKKYNPVLTAYEAKVDSLQQLLALNRADDNFFQKLQAGSNSISNFKSYLLTLENKVISGEVEDSLANEAQQMNRFFEMFGREFSNWQATRTVET